MGIILLPKLHLHAKFQRQALCSFSAITLRTSTPFNRRRTTHRPTNVCVFGYACISRFCCYDNPMTLVHVFNPDILKMYLRITNEVSKSRLSKVTACTNRTDIRAQTDATERITTAAVANGKSVIFRPRRYR